MEALTNIAAMLSGKSIVVPNYQRAYSWETDLTDKSQKQVNTFLTDLQNYVNSKSSSPYYLGHFLLEERNTFEYGIIDGQQRLTTSVIFISALYRRLKEIKKTESIKDFGDDLYVAYCNTIKQGSSYRFSTVEYDNQMFRDYVIDQTLHDRNELDTISKERIANAFDFFCKKLADKSEDELLPFLEAVSKASCTTHVVKDEIEAVQMFIFQNNRGKKPTKLEIIKAQFMYHIHLYAPFEERNTILSEITTRFEHIYRSITEIDNGYCPYDEEFYNRYLECLGNYLLLSGPHNISLSNSRFQIKRESYTHLQQQLEVQRMTERDLHWNKEKIQQRHSKIVDFLMQIL